MIEHEVTGGVGGGELSFSGLVNQVAADDLAARFRREARADRLFEEVAFVAYHFNWSHETVLNMPHWERHQWCEEISRINERMNEDRDR